MARGSLPRLHRASRQNHLPGSAHADRVIFERRAATEADLIVLAMKAAVRPREAVWTQPSKNLLEECGHTRLATKHVEDLRQKTVRLALASFSAESTTEALRRRYTLVHLPSGKWPMTRFAIDLQVFRGHEGLLRRGHSTLPGRAENVP